MKQNNHSITAYKVAIMRAAHQLLDNPRIFEDPIALNLIESKDVSEIQSKTRKFRTKLHKYLRAIVVARSVIVENELSIAVKNGVRQYVILGSGLDTFAYRNPHSNIGLNVFEVDYPGTQKWKRQLLAEAKIPTPTTLRFCPIDFEKQSLIDQLKKTGFKTDEPSFFSWLGVTMYLTREAMMATMKFISSSIPTGSGIVFDYVVPASSQNFLRRLIFHLLSKKVGKIGEPWKSFYDPYLLLKDLKAIGFKQIEDIGPEKINTLYFENRRDNLMVGNFGHLMKAQV